MNLTINWLAELWRTFSLWNFNPTDLRASGNWYGPFYVVCAAITAAVSICLFQRIGLGSQVAAASRSKEILSLPTALKNILP